MSCDCCEALPRGSTGLSAVCDCGIALSYSLTIFVIFKYSISSILSRSPNFFSFHMASEQLKGFKI